MTSDLESLTHAAQVYLPAEQRLAIALGLELPEQTQGAALFADISGFTPLTEALTRALGLRRGAEELPIHLDRVYDALIAEVERFGGSVIGFAGDAITCWFDDQPPGQAGAPPAARRAAACALALQAAIRNFAAIPVPGEAPVALSLKVAVASGTVRRMIVGDPGIQRIALIAGETVMRMADGEHHANKGEVIFDAATVQALGELAQVSEWRDAFAVVAALDGLEGPAAELPWPPAAATRLDPQAVRAWVHAPIYTRLSAGLGDFLTELRPATALFLKFGGIDYDADPQAAAKLDAYIRWAQGILEKHEAVLTHPTIGDKGSFLCISFGAPLAHDDDSRRAAAAALELARPPEALGFITPAQIGLSQGLARTGSYGGSLRKTYDILGDQVNLAARLMTLAQPGQILTSQRVQEQIEADFELESLPPVMVKGKSYPIAIARLDGRRQQTAERLLEGEGTLFGRQAELAQMEAVLELALAGQPQIVHLSGAAGVGKSRLAVEFACAASGRGLRLLAGAGQSTRQEAPFAAWQGIFRSLLQLRPDEPDPAGHLRCMSAEANPAHEALYPLLGALVGLEVVQTEESAALDPQLRFQATLTLAVEQLAAAAAAGALLVWLDDVQWLDESSLALLQAAARGLAGLPALLLLVQRPGDERLAGLAAIHGYTKLELGILDQPAIQALVAERLGAPGAALIVDVVQSQAQGNPYFAGQLLDAMRETGSLAQVEGRWGFPESVINALRDANCIQKNLDSGEWEIIPGAHLPTSAIGVPEGVQGALLARVDRLPADQQLSLRAASVLGRSFELPVLARAHPAGVTAQALQAQAAVFIERGFLQPEADQPDSLAFTNNALQEVLYSALPTATQEQVHGLAGQALEALHPQGLAGLAYHYTRAGASFRDKAIEYLDLASCQAQRDYANATALNYYRQALALEQRWYWRASQAEVLHILGVRDEQKAAIDALETLADAPPAEAARLRFELCIQTGEFDTAQAAAETSLALARETGDWQAEAEALRQLGLARRRLNDNAGALGYYEQALELYRRQAEVPESARLTRARLLSNTGILHYRQKRFDQARITLEMALVDARFVKDRNLEIETQNVLGLTATDQGDWATARRHFEQTIAVAQAAGARQFGAHSMINAAQVERRTGQFRKAEEFLANGLRLMQATGDLWNQVSAWNELSVLYQDSGQYTRAEQALEQTASLSRQIDDQEGLAYALYNRAVVQREQNQLDAAAATIQEGLELVTRLGDAFLAAAYLGQLGLVRLAQQRFAEAIELAQQALVKRQEMSLEEMTSDNLVTLARAYSEQGHREQALTYARQAMQLLSAGSAGCEGCENPVQDLWLLYQTLQALGENALAAQVREQGRGVIEARASAIQDPDLRAAYLQNVPGCRGLLQAVD